MKWLIAATTILWGVSTQANDAVELTQLAIQYGRDVRPGRVTLLHPRYRKDSVALLLDMDVLSYFYWSNHLLGEFDSGGQARGVTWSFNLGVRIAGPLSVEYGHQSAHRLDETHPFSGYPLQDTVGIRLQIFNNPSTNRTLF